MNHLIHLEGASIVVDEADSDNLDLLLLMIVIVGSCIS